MKAKEVITYIVFLIIIIVITILNKNELLEIKQRYEVVQEEKQLMIIENNELREQLQRVLEEQDSRTNNIDTRE
mgnify:CR=1 FL=1